MGWGWCDHGFFVIISLRPYWVLKIVSPTPGAVVRLVPETRYRLLMVVLILIVGYLGFPLPITTLEVEPGTALPAQLPAFSHAVLILPVQLKVIGAVPATYSFSHTIAGRSVPFSRTINAPCSVLQWPGR